MTNGDGTMGTIHKSYSKQHASQKPIWWKQNCQACSSLQECVIPADEPSIFTVLTRTTKISRLTLAELKQHGSPRRALHIPGCTA